MTHPVHAGCDAFDAQLADYLEHTLGADERGAADAHLATCPRCQTLVSDLRTIVRDAAALGPIEPPRDLWAGIAARIEAPVVPIGATHPATSRRVVVTRRWLAIAASVLVATSIGGTYGVMCVADRSPAPTIVATAPTDVTAPKADTTPTPDAMPPATTEVPNAPNGSVAPDAPYVPNASRARTVAAVVAIDTLVPAATTYDHEIAALRVALTHRRDLDAGTVAVVERNLAIIDDAIAACRNALAHDPHNRLLGDQLTHTLDRKVELLRTAVLLPARS